MTHGLDKTELTLNGKFDARCRECLRAVYCLWVSDEPPPRGCSDGHDDEIWKCPTVYNALVAIVVRLDHRGGDLHPAQTYLLKRLGPKATEIMADIRAGKSPPNYRSKEPRYDLPPATRH